MLTNLTWVPFDNPITIAGFPISGIHILPQNVGVGRPAFALPLASVSSEPPGSGSHWTPPLYRSFLQWWSQGRPTRQNDPITESCIRIAFPNWELRLLTHDHDSRLLSSLGELQQCHQDIFLRTGLSQKLNQLAQFSAYRQGVDHHHRTVEWLRSLVGGWWGKEEINLKLTGFIQAEDNVDEETALLAVWADLDAEEQRSALAAWQPIREQFINEFRRCYPRGFAPGRPVAKTPFVYRPSHQDVSQSLDPSINLGLEVYDFYAGGELSGIIGLFRSLLTAVLVGGAKTELKQVSVGTVSPEPERPRQGEGVFNEVIVREGSKCPVGEPIAQGGPKELSRHAIDPNRLKLALNENELVKSLLGDIFTANGAGSKEHPALISQLRISLQAGNLPPEYAHLLHVGSVGVVRVIIEDAKGIVAGGSTFHILTGHNGAGKTHHLQLAERIGLAAGLVVLTAELRPDCRFHGKEARRLINELVSSLKFKNSPKGKGLASLLDAIIIRAKEGDTISAAGLEKAVSAICEPLMDQPGGIEMTDMVVKYALASKAGDKAIMAKILAWFRADYASPAEVKRALGVTGFIGDSDLVPHLRLLTTLVQIGGHSGILVLIDELTVLTRNLHGTTRQANQDALLNILNDTLAGRLPRLGFIFGGTPDCLDARQRGLLTSEALKSRLQSAQASDGNSPGLIVEVNRMAAEDMFILLQNLRSVRLPEPGWTERLPNAALQALVAKLLRPLGANEGLTPRDLLKTFEQLARVLEQTPSRSWEQALGESVQEIKQQQQTLNLKTDKQSLRNLKL